MQRAAELKGLRGVHQLDCEYLLCILDNPYELRCGVGAHTDVVLLSLRRRNGIRAGREAETLALADNGCRRILRNHKAAVQSRFRHQERRKAPLTAYKLVNPALRNVRELGHCQSQHIHRQGYRLAVEIACRNDHILIREHGRIVRHTVDFHFYDAFHVFDRVLRGSVYLRYATEGIRVLHVLLRSAYYFAAFQ